MWVPISRVILFFHKVGDIIFVDVVRWEWPMVIFVVVFFRDEVSFVVIQVT